MKTNLSTISMQNMLKIIYTIMAISFAGTAFAGSANNQLAEPHLARILKDMGILYAPDFAINAGGVILLAGEAPDGKFNKRIVNKKLKEIGPTLTKIFRAHEDENKTTLEIANQLAEERLNA